MGNFLGLFFGALVSFAAFAPNKSLADFELKSASPSAQAELENFFFAFEGNWAGGGTISELSPNGQWYHTQYSMRVSVSSYYEANRWDVHSEVVNSSHILKIQDLIYRVAGDTLFVSDNSPYEPVGILESTDTRLRYYVQRANRITGRVYLLSFTMELLGPQSISGSVEVSLNGSVVQEDHYWLKR